MCLWSLRGRWVPSHGLEAPLYVALCPLPTIKQMCSSTPCSHHSIVSLTRHTSDFVDFNLSLLCRKIHGLPTRKVLLSRWCRSGIRVWASQETTIPPTANATHILYKNSGQWPGAKHGDLYNVWEVGTGKQTQVLVVW